MKPLHCCWLPVGHLTHVFFFTFKKQAEIIVASHMGRPNEGSERTDKPFMRNCVLALHVLINQSSLVYADANTARISPHPYQLKQSGQQSIIFRATRHVVMHTVWVFTMPMCACYSTVHISLLNTWLLSNFQQMKRKGDKIQ